MNTSRYLQALLAVLIANVTAHAHDRFEGTVDIRASAECLEIVVIVPSATVSGLLKSADNRLITIETLPALQPALLSTSDKVCLLEDAEPKALQPSRVQLSVGENGELCYLFEYPSATQPSTIKVALLAMLPSPHFFVVTDHRAEPARRSVLVRDHSSFAMSAAVATPKSP